MREVTISYINDLTTETLQQLQEVTRNIGITGEYTPLTITGDRVWSDITAITGDRVWSDITALTVEVRS